jgi:hypothetical protein
VNKQIKIVILISLVTLLVVGLTFFYLRFMKSPGKSMSNTQDSRNTANLPEVNRNNLKEYNIADINDWDDFSTSKSGKNKYLRKDDYAISFERENPVESGCDYPNLPANTTPSQSFDKYLEFINPHGNKFRRSWNGEAATVTEFTVCEFTKHGWRQLTELGNIKFYTPENSDPVILDEMTRIVAQTTIRT